jgi:hypothetical protein
MHWTLPIGYYAPRVGIPLPSIGEENQTYPRYDSNGVLWHYQFFYKLRRVDAKSGKMLPGYNRNVWRSYLPRQRG